MAFIPLPNGVKVELKYTLNGKACVNVLWFTKPVITVTVDFPALGGAIKDWWVDTQAAAHPTSMSLDEIVITEWAAADGAQLTFTEDLPAAGTNASPALPNNVALVVSLRTGYTGRSFRGRMYVPGLHEGQVVGDDVSLLIASDFATGAELLASMALDEGFLWVVASFHHDLAPRVTGVPSAITSFVVNTRVDTQRRRLT